MCICVCIRVFTLYIYNCVLGYVGCMPNIAKSGVDETSQPESCISRRAAALRFLQRRHLAVLVVSSTIAVVKNV